LGVLPVRPIGKRRAAPDSETLKHGICGGGENTYQREFAERVATRQKLPREGNFCRVVAANISTLTKRRRAFVGKILVKKHAYEKLALRTWPATEVFL
jgi:hypothetical protein